jgi:hypothetical protein
MMVAGTLKMEAPVNNELQEMLKQEALPSLETPAQRLPVGTEEFLTQHNWCLD